MANVFKIGCLGKTLLQFCVIVLHLKVLHMQPLSRYVHGLVPVPGYVS